MLNLLRNSGSIFEISQNLPDISEPRLQAPRYDPDRGRYESYGIQPSLADLQVVVTGYCSPSSPVSPPRTGRARSRTKTTEPQWSRRKSPTRKRETIALLPAASPPSSPSPTQIEPKREEAAATTARHCRARSFQKRRPARGRPEHGGDPAAGQVGRRWESRRSTGGWRTATR